MSGKITTALVALCMAGMWATTASRAEIGTSDKEIVLGACNVTSGPAQFYGHQTNIGINCYFENLNAAGGVNGRKVRVITEDDRYEPDGAIAAFNKMKEKGVFGITGLVGSICLAKYLPMAESSKLPAIGYYPGPLFVSEPAKKYCFSARASYRDEMKQAVKHLWKDVGIRRIGVIYQNDSYGADCLEGVKDALREYAAEVVATGAYTRNKDVNVNEAYNSVKKADPEAVILGAVYKPAAEVAKLAHDQNWHPIFVMNSGTGVDAFMEQAGNAASENYIFTEVAPPVARTDLKLVQDFTKSLAEHYPKEKPNFVSLRGYIDAMVIGEGLKRTGKDLTREKFVNTLEKIHDLNVGLGKGMDLSYSPTDHLGFHNVFWCQIKNGNIISFADWKSLKPVKKK